MATDALPSKPDEQAERTELQKEVEDFSGHCTLIRSVYVLALKLWRDVSEDDRKLFEGIAPVFVEVIGQVLAEYAVLSACGVTDPAKDGKNHENLTCETFVDAFSGTETEKVLDDLLQQMMQHRTKIEPARNKLIAHADREAIRSGKPLGLASWDEWATFWATLRKFINVLNEKALGTPYDIDVAGVPGDAVNLLKALKQSRYFETMLETGDRAVKGACLRAAMAVPPEKVDVATESSGRVR